MRFLALAIVSIASAATMSAAEVTVNVHRHTANADPHTTGKVMAQSAADPGKSLTFSLPSKVTLPKGEWFATPQIDGDWGEPRLLSIGDQPQTVELNTYPLARLTAKVTLPNGKVPRELQA